MIPYLGRMDARVGARERNLGVSWVATRGVGFRLYPGNPRKPRILRLSAGH